MAGDESSVLPLLSFVVFAQRPVVCVWCGVDGDGDGLNPLQAFVGKIDTLQNQG